jgi:hypothetical protein
LGNEEILRMALPAIRSDYRAIETYRHAEGVRLSAPITVLTGDADPRVSLDEASDWSVHTTARCEMKSSPAATSTVMSLDLRGRDSRHPQGPGPVEGKAVSGVDFSSATPARTVVGLSGCPAACSAALEP